MKLIGLSGKARHGKDSVADILGQRRNCARVGFADALKDGAAAIFGLTERQLYGDLKESVDAFWGRSPRQLMQLLGTECVRNQIDENAWIKAAQRRIEKLAVSGVTGIIIPDVRFPNEYEAVKSWGGEVWRVERAGVAAVNLHLSESMLDDFSFDATIQNNAGLVELRDAAIRAFDFASSVPMS